LSEKDYGLCPSCPDIKRKIDRIDLALLGEDGTGMKSGIVFTITKLQTQNRVADSWVGNVKPFLVAAGTALVTFAITYWLAAR
jgi:hypothetical protein